jgi:hypothetical protein
LVDASHADGARVEWDDARLLLRLPWPAPPSAGR